MWFYSYIAGTTKLSEAWRLGVTHQSSVDSPDCYLVHKCCTVDDARVSRRNHVFELFLEWSEYGVAHFDVEAAILENVSFNKDVDVNIRRHHCRHHETKHERGCFISVVVSEVFCALDDGIHVMLVESKYGHVLRRDDARCA